MRFFEHQALARKSTTKLIVLFSLAVIGVVLAVNAAVAFLSPFVSGKSFVRIEHHVMISLVTALIILGASAFRYWTLRLRGGISMALELGGRNIEPTTDVEGERRLLNVVEEMSIASGVPMPEVFVFEDQAINAFAMGLTTKDAAVGVTRGTLDLLNREELQAVVGHEFSHILNGDMRLNTRVHACLHGMMAISSIGRAMLQAPRGSSRQKGTGGFVLLGLAFIVIGWFGVFLGRIIQAAMCRQREYLADASSVQFTRNPLALGKALQKIMGQSQRAFEGHAFAAEFQHMFFAEAFTSWLGGLTATHPPLEDRIRRVRSLKPSDKIEPIAASPHNVSSSQKQPQLASLGVSGFHEAGVWVSAMSSPLRSAIHETYSVRAVIYALFVSKDVSVQQAQEQEFKRRQQSGIWTQSKKISQELDQAGSASRIPIVEIAIPTLRRLSQTQLTQFFELLNALASADRHLSISEFSLIQLLKVNLLPKSARSAAPSRAELRSAVTNLVGAFFHLAGKDFDTRNRLASIFVAKWGQGLADSLDWVPGSTASLAQSLEDLSHLPVSAKERLTETLAECVLFDREVLSEETELLKCVSAALGVPIPSVLRNQIGLKHAS